MENSSSSKTRSPARVLAALLAVVMLFIVMPVLPAGAEPDGKVNSITFVNALSSGTNRNVFFEPDKPSNNVNKVDSDGNGTETSISWGGLTLKAKRVNGEGVEEKTDVKVWLDQNAKFGPDFDDASLEFALFAASSDMVAYYSKTSGGAPKTWIPLSSNRTVPYKGQVCKVYTIPQGEMEGDIYIKADSVKPTYTVTFSVDPDATVTVGSSEESIKEPVYSGDTIDVVDDSEGRTGANLFLKVAKKEGYTPIVRVSNGLTAEDQSGSYKIAGITKNITVTVTLEKETYTVSKGESDTDYTVSIKTPQVSYNDSAEFSVQVPEGHKDPTVTIKMGNNPLSAGDSTYTVTKTGSTLAYTIYHVTGNVEVTVKKAGMIRHTVTVALGEGFTVEVDGENTQTSQTVDYGTEFKFTVKPEKGWETTTPIVTANGTQILPDADGDEANGWKYTVEIKANTTISVSGFSRKTYTVTVANDMEQYNLTAYPSSVVHGQGFTFTLNLTNSYEVKGQLTVTCTGAEVSGEFEGGKRSYTVTVTEAKGPVSISFSGITKRTYNVTVKPEKDDMKDMYKVTEGDSKSVDYGNRAVFAITPENGYRIVSVYEKDATGAITVLTGVNNVYTSSAVTSDGTDIFVKAEIITYTVKYYVTSSVKLGNTSGETLITRKYTVKNKTEGDEEVFTVADGKVTLDLTGVEPTRKGWTFSGWQDLKLGGVTFEQETNNDSNDHEYELRAEWVVNTDEAGNNAFFSVTCKMNKADDVTTFVATVKTNLDIADIDDMNGRVSVVAYGFFYTNNQDTIGNLSKDTQTTADTISQLKNATAKKTAKYGNTDGLYFYKFEMNATNAMTSESTFKFHMRGTKEHDGYVGAAWVILNINGVDYLFVSTPASID